MVELSERVAHARALRILNRAGVPYAVAGAVALGYYTGIWRHTKDLDLFLPPSSIAPAMEALRKDGYATEIVAPHWLAKAVRSDWLVDLISGFGDWRTLIDDLFLTRAHHTKVYGVPARVISPEELLWVKSYVSHRERYDGADNAHILLATADRLDWLHLLWRFGPDWELLLAQLLLFSMIYPSERDRIPKAVWDELLGRLAGQLHQANCEDPVCHGTLLDRFSYIPDIESWGFWDARTRWAVRSGFHPSVIVADRREAARMVMMGKVRPAEIA